MSEEAIIAAHNGIVCEKDSVGSEGLYYCILLLRDSYRPVMGMERDGIQMLPMEALIDWQLIWVQNLEEGYSIRSGLDLHNLEAKADWTAQQYLDLSRKRPDFVSRMYIFTMEGALSPKQWQQSLRNCQSLELIGRINLRMSSYCFMLAWLQSQFVLRVRLDRSKRSVILATAEKPTPGDTCWLDFPPTFFLLPEQENCPYLTEIAESSRCSYNANHPLSRFLIDNADKLRKHTPGVFRDIMH